MKANRDTMKKEGMPSGRIHPASLDQLRALAHPLRLRMLELFAEGPRTTKQVAQRLGEPPTKLYHHANALERAGLLRLTRTRQNRGAVEKWYEAAQQAWSGGQVAGSRPLRRAVSGLASVALEQTRREVELAIAKPSSGRPLVMRMTAIGDSRRIEDIRKRLLEFLKQLREEKSQAKPVGKNADKRWTLTVAFAPAARSDES